MSSDADYASFLDKANQDTGASKASTQQSSSQQQKYSTQSVDTDVPAAVKDVDEYYTSEADEPFEPVSLKWSGGGELGAADFKKLLGHNEEVEEMSVKEFDPQGQYKTVVEAVKKVGEGDVKVFRVGHGKTRAEYYVVAVDGKGGRVVGLKAKAVES